MLTLADKQRLQAVILADYMAYTETFAEEIFSKLLDSARKPKKGKRFKQEISLARGRLFRVELIGSLNRNEAVFPQIGTVRQVSLLQLDITIEHRLYANVPYDTISLASSGKVLCDEDAGELHRWFERWVLVNIWDPDLPIKPPSSLA